MAEWHSAGSCQCAAELHRRITALVPEECVTIYSGREPNDEELLAITRLAQQELLEVSHQALDGSRVVDRDAFRRRVLHPYRARGLVVQSRQMADYRFCVVDPVQRCVGFSVPSEAALDVLSQYAPLVEVGAGTGYWAAALEQRGVDVLAFDAQPPTPAFNNAFFNATFTMVRACQGNIFAGAAGAALSSQRTLLLVWPLNNDVNEQRGAPENGTSPWDADCLRAFVAAGGRTVAYVGERRESLPACAHAECGVSSSSRLQEDLKAGFTLIEQVALPHWWFEADDLTIWIRNG